MAGIGFALRQLSRQETLSAVLKSSGHAAVIAAGPWLFTIFSLASITALAERLAGHDALATFRATVIYSFATSLVLTAPITIVATRKLADYLWKRDVAHVRNLLVVAMAMAIAVVGAGAVALAIYFSVPLPLAVALFATAQVVALIWVALAFCGAVRDYWGITASFIVGLVVSIACATAAAIAGVGAAGMVWGFTAGLAITFFGLTLRVLTTFPAAAQTTLMQEAHELLKGFGTYGFLAVGALFGTAGVWIDKWVFWFSSEGESVTGGLIHAPLYDSAMFIASLVLIPALSQFVVQLETEFFEHYQSYYGTIQSHGTIDQIEAQRLRLQGGALESLALITVTQTAVAAMLLLTAPAIVDILNLQFRQIAILRYGALGSVFLFIFIAATSMVVFFDRRRLYCALQCLFFTLNLVLTALTASWGEDYYGVGFFAAAVISAAVAVVIADRTFEKLNYLTFIGNNPSITGSWQGVWKSLSGWR